MSGHLGDLSPSQQKALEEFRDIFKDVLLPQHDDHLLLQFLRARKFDLKKAEEMFRRHLDLRKEFPEDYYANEYQLPKNIAILADQLIPPALGYDKDGCPIRLVKAGNQDIKGLLRCVRPSELKKYVIWFLDNDKKEMRKRSRETGVHIEKRTFIFDLEGLHIMHLYRRDVYDMANSFLKTYEDNYPENLKVAYFINIPFIFHYLFNNIKPLLSEDTFQKLKIYGSSGWKEPLLEYFGADLLPVIYGGTRTDPDGDPSCPSLWRVINSVPKELYLKNINNLSEDDEDVRKFTVRPWCKHRIHLKVDHPGSSVGWEVQCKRHNIKVYLAYDEGPRREIVVQPLLVCSDFGSETRSYLAERTGKYSLVLDNSYSTFRSKQVLYKAYVNTATAVSYNETKTMLDGNDSRALSNGDVI